MRTLKNNEYLITMKPMLYLMKIICALPISLKLQNVLPNFITSTTITWMIIVWHIFIHIRFVRLLVFEIILDRNGRNIISLVANGPGIVFELFCLVAPMSMWKRSKEIQEYWDAWGNFQLKYEAISGVPYVSKKRSYITKATLICLAWITLRCLYAAWFHFHIYTNKIDFVISSFLLFVVYVISFYWFCNCAYVWSTSKDILNLGKKIISEKQDDCKLNQIVSIWSTMNDLTKHFNEAHSYLYLSFFMMTVMNITTNSYALLHYSVYKVIFPFTFYANSLVIFAVFLIILLEPSHIVYHQTNRRQKEALLQENTMQIGPTTLKSVLRYLQTISLQDSTIVLNGFVTMNRMTFPAILSLCLNYLIVLQQFYET